jgi:ADP-ribose pyrophosphatase YjhB (NUDIX family)
MITFSTSNARFALRAAAIVLHPDLGVLLHRSIHDDFWALPGGRCELLETAEETIRREMREELEVDVIVRRLVWVVENFFEHEGTSHHEVGLYFLVDFAGDSSLYQGGGPFNGMEEGIPLVFQWFPLDQLEGVQLYPAFLRRKLRAVPQFIEHVVHTDGED